MSRYSALLDLANYLDEFQLNVNTYFGDLEFSSLSDSVIYGKIAALRSGLKQHGFASLLNTLDELDLSPGNVIQVLETLRGYLVPELRQQIEERIANGVEPDHTAFWTHLHPRIETVARSRFQSGHYADAVEAALKEVNSSVKAQVKLLTGDELDGAKLMNETFSLKNPIIKLADLSTESGRSIQLGYMQLFAGAMTGIRNIRAHDNRQDDPREAIHCLFLASLLMFAFDYRESEPT